MANLRVTFRFWQGSIGNSAFALLLLTVLCTAWEEEKLGPVIGIDLGSTYSCVGVYKEGRVHIIPNDQGKRITPSYVAFTDTERLIGEAAKSQAYINPKRTIYDVKHLIGRRYDDKEVQAARKLLSYDVVERDGKPYISVEVNNETHVFSPEEISAIIIHKMKETAESYLGQPVQYAVVTVPAYFNDAQRQATKDAGTIAGLNVLRLLNEPNSAARAYDLDKRGGDKAEASVLVYHLGGSTLDVTVLFIDNGVFEVISNQTGSHLGGNHFDQRVMQYFIGLVKKKYGKDISGDAHALQKLRREVERAKWALSSHEEVRIEIPALYDGIDLSEPLTRTHFEELNMDLFESTRGHVSEALRDANLTKSEVGDIVLVGGSIRIPKVQELLKEFFDGKEPIKGVNPDEAVAYGTAFVGGILGGEFSVQSEWIIDYVAPLDLGIQTAGGLMSAVIRSVVFVPSKRTLTFTTNTDNQSSVTIQVFQGNRALAKDNIQMGHFDLTGIPPAPSGTPQIEVTFEVTNDDRSLNVTAEVKGTGKAAHIAFAPETVWLSDADYERLYREAEDFHEADMVTRARLDARNRLESYCYAVQHSLGDLSSKVEARDWERAVAAVVEALRWLEVNPLTAGFRGSPVGVPRQEALLPYVAAVKEAADENSYYNEVVSDEVAEKYKAKLKETEDVCSPIIASAYRSGRSGGTGEGMRDEEQVADRHDEL